MPNQVEVQQNRVFQACHNASYIRGEFHHEPYIMELVKKKGSQVADIITPLLEMFHLIEKETKSIFSFTEDFNFKQRHFEPGVYLKTKEILNGVETFDGLAIVDIPSGSFRSIVIDSGGGIASSKHTIEQFKELKGRYLIPFYFDGIYVHPHCYTYFFIENDIKRVMPLEAYDSSKVGNEQNMGLHWVEEAIEYGNLHFGFEVETPDTETIIEKV